MPAASPGGFTVPVPSMLMSLLTQPPVMLPASMPLAAVSPALPSTLTALLKLAFTWLDVTVTPDSVISLPVRVVSPVMTLLP